MWLCVERSRYAYALAALCVVAGAAARRAGPRTAVGDRPDRGQRECACATLTLTQLCRHARNAVSGAWADASACCGAVHGIVSIPIEACGTFLR